MDGQLRRPVVVVTMALALVVPTGAAIAAVNAQSVTEVDSCTTIAESGEYRLTGDVGANASDGACLDVTASDVTIDGGGHTIAGDGSGYGVRFAVDDATLRDVAVSNWEYGVYGRAAGTRGATIALDDVALTENGDGLLVEYATLSVADSTIARNDDLGLDVTGGDVDVRNTAVTGNGDDGIAADKVAEFFVTGSQFRDNDVGVSVYMEDATIERSLFSGNRIGVAFLDSVGTLRYNVFTEDSGGLNVEETTVVDARENWWGARSGPSSGPSGGVEDAATGVVADGTGADIVTALSDVRFDPYYVTDPRDGDGTLSNEVQEDTPTATPTEEPPETTEPATETPGEPTTTAPTEDPATEEPPTATPTDPTETPRRSTETPDDGAGTGDGDGQEPANGGEADASDDDTPSSEPDERRDGERTDERSTDREEPSTETRDAGKRSTATATPAGSATATTAGTGTTEAAAGPSAPVDGTETTAAPTAGGDQQTARVIGGDGTTSSGAGPGFGVVAALLALVVSALLAARRR